MNLEALLLHKRLRFTTLTSLWGELQPSKILWRSFFAFSKIVYASFGALPIFKKKKKIKVRATLCYLVDIVYLPRVDISKM